MLQSLSLPETVLPAANELAVLRLAGAHASLFITVTWLVVSVLAVSVPKSMTYGLTCDFVVVVSHVLLLTTVFTSVRLMPVAPDLAPIAAPLRAVLFSSIQFLRVSLALLSSSMPPPVVNTDLPAA